MAAEPNRNPRQHPEIQPEIRPALRVISGDGESSPERGNLRTADTASDLREQEHKFGVIQGGGESTPERGNLQSVDGVREKEAAAGGWQNNYTGNNTNNSGKQRDIFKAAWSKKGPVGLILAFLGIGGFGASSITGLVPMIPGIAAENAYGNVSRAQQYHYKATYKYRFGNAAACGNAASIRCKMATVNDRTLKRYEKDGFTVESEKVGDRHIIKSMKFPDGTVVTTAEGFVTHMDTSVAARSKLFGVFSPRSGPYTGQNFTNKVLKKLGIDKTRITISGRDRDAVARSFDQHIGASENRTEENENTRRQAESETKLKTTKSVDRVKNVLGAVCAGYDTARISMGLIKFKNIVKYIAFGWFFVKLGHQIKAGDADSTTIAAGAAVLTTVAASGESKGKSAMDSAGMRSMLHGDRSNLGSLAQKILLGGNPALVKLDNTLTYVKKQVGGSSVHATCKAADNLVVGGALTVAMCAGGGGAAGTIIPGLGNAIGGLVGTITCTATNLVLAIGGGVLFGYIMEQVMPSLLDYLASAPAPSFDMPVEDAGNAITIAAAAIFGKTGLTTGMKLGTKEEVTDFNKVAAQADMEYIQVARYDARNTPFDITNQYSFAGQIANQLSIASSGSNIIATTLSTIGSALTGAQSSLLTSAAYAAEMPSSIKATTLGPCQDPELNEQNLACDTVGGTYTVQTKTEMTRSTETNLAYMISNGYIDEDGTVKEDKDYAKFTKYCTAEADEVPGTTTMSIADDDYDWPTERCNENTQEISNFRTYQSRLGMVSDEDTAYSDGATAAAPNETVIEGADIGGDDYKSEVRSVLGRAGTGQCVDFVLFRLVKHKVLDGPVALGNGKDVVGTLGSRYGYKVNNTPAVHSVMSTAATSHPDLGHTAMVSQVNADGSFVVEEYNFIPNKPETYGTRTIPASDIAAKGMTFAHTEVDYK
jgi:surface antigen